MSKKCLKMSKGFTLIEVMIVASIILILLAVAVPAYKEWIAHQECLQDSDCKIEAEVKAKAVEKAEAESRNQVEDAYRKFTHYDIVCLSGLEYIVTGGGGIVPHYERSVLDTLVIKRCF